MPFYGHTLGANSQLSIAINRALTLILKLGAMTNNNNSIMFSNQISTSFIHQAEVKQ